MKTDQEKLQLCSKRLRKLRNEVGLTMDELRVEMETKNNAKYSNSAYCRWENALRMPPIDIVEAFADYFGVSAVEHFVNSLVDTEFLRLGSEQNIVIIMHAQAFCKHFSDFSATRTKLSAKSYNKILCHKSTPYFKSWTDIPSISSFSM